MSLVRIALAILFGVALLIACSKAPVLGGKVKVGSIKDGVYVGIYKSPPNSAKVEVTVEGGRIAHVTLLRHGASWVGAKAENIIPERIVDEQSTDVDVVSGATNSSHVIMNAVQVALDKAARGDSSESAEEPE